MPDTQKIIDRFKAETIKTKKQVKTEVIGPKTKLKKSVTKYKDVEVEVMVIGADDFDALVQEVFQFPEGKQQYNVRLDLWGALQKTLDHHFHIPAKGHLSTKPIIDGFKKTGESIGRVRYLLDHFVQEKLIPPGRYVIRFQPEARNPK